MSSAMWLATGVSLLVGLVSLAMTRWLVQPHAFVRILDHPNERSLHTQPIPRTGGIAVCGSLLIGWLMFISLPHTQAIPPNILFGAAIVAGMSMLDDRFDLPAAFRFLIQVLAAWIVVEDGFVVSGELLPGLAISSVSVTMAFTLVMTVWLTNLYNFMDGMDGFAGGMAVIGFATLAFIGWQHEQDVFAGAALCISAAAAGFLRFNFPPARIFMGDTGSTTLGLLVAGFAVWGSRLDIAPVWVTLVVFSPFVVDATVTLISRIWHREPVWKPHRKHYYQRLVTLGWGHRRTVLAEYGVMVACSLLAIVMGRHDALMQWGMLTALAAAYAATAWGIHRLENSHATIKR